MRSGRIIAVPRSGAIWRAGLRLMILLGLAVAAAAVPCAAQGILNVSLDKAKLIKYPPSTETIIVGNPIIADVTMLKNSGILILTGKGYGETNLVFLDRNGAILSETNLRVEQSEGMLTVQRGTDRESYSCHPRCQPAISLGDASAFFNGAANETQQRNTLAVPSGSPTPASGH